MKVEIDQLYFFSKLSSLVEHGVKSYVEVSNWTVPSSISFLLWLRLYNSLFLSRMWQKSQFVRLICIVVSGDGGYIIYLCKALYSRNTWSFKPCMQIPHARKYQSVICSLSLASFSWFRFYHIQFMITGPQPHFMVQFSRLND